MLDGWHDGQRVGSGTVIWHARNLMAAGKLDYEGFMTLATASSPSIGHCNTMGTALSMNSLAEALGMSLPTCASIPRPTAARPDGLRHRQTHLRHGVRGRRAS